MSTETTVPAGGTFEAAVREHAEARFSGVLRIDGNPGGVVHFVDGGITACKTPGAPSLEVILLRSGRIAESGWDASFTASAVSDRPMTAELVERGLIGAGELEALLRTAVADAMFALASGSVDGWSTYASPGEQPLPLVPGARTGWLLAEAMRRTQALAAFGEPALSAADRFVAAPGAVRLSPPPSPGQDEILALADGRRTARDLAFALGHGLYATMRQLGHMRANGVVISPHEKGRRIRAVDGPGSALHEETDGNAPELPRRRGDRTSLPHAGGAGRRNVANSLWLLRPRSEEGTGPGGAQ